MVPAWWSIFLSQNLTRKKYEILYLQRQEAAISLEACRKERTDHRSRRRVIYKERKLHEEYCNTLPCLCCACCRFNVEVMKFKKGQKLVCTNKGGWFATKKFFRFWTKLINPIGPKFNEIVTLEAYNPANFQFMALREYELYTDGLRHCYDEQFFEPLVSDETLEEELSKVKQPFEV
jgi:hypothetical protein